MSTQELIDLTDETPAGQLRTFWAQNFPELSLVRKSTYNALDALIRADERAKMRRRVTP